MDALPLTFGNPLRDRLHEALLEIIQEDRFDNLSTCEVVGVLEFLKWNFINRSDS